MPRGMKRMLQNTSVQSAAPFIVILYIYCAGLSVTKTDSNLFGSLYRLILRRNHFQLSCTFCQRYALDLAVYHTDHHSVLLVQNRLCSAGADPRGKNTVVRAGLSASLNMTRNSYPHFAADLLKNLVSDLIGN